jgi:hypothetical protein
VLELGAVGVTRGGIGEVAVLDAPIGDGVGDPIDELADGALPGGGAELAAEVLLHHHVGGGLAPALGDLHVALLEHGLAALSGDAGRARLPLDAAVAVVTCRGEIPLHADAGGGLAGAPAGRLAVLRDLPVRLAAAIASAVLFVEHQHSLRPA